jgi:hypothetical protein
MSALKYKIFRSHIVARTLKRSHLPLQDLPSPQNYGWELNNTSLEPMMTDNLPAPLALIELIACGCNGDCGTQRCKCFKNNLVCTDMCKCTIECTNDDQFECKIDESDVSVEENDSEED